VPHGEDRPGTGLTAPFPVPENVVETSAILSLALFFLPAPAPSRNYFNVPKTRLKEGWPAGSCQSYQGPGALSLCSHTTFLLLPLPVAIIEAGKASVRQTLMWVGRLQAAYTRFPRAQELSDTVPTLGCRDSPAHLVRPRKNHQLERGRQKDRRAVDHPATPCRGNRGFDERDFATVFMKRRNTRSSIMLSIIPATRSRS
jgi:hypothetical protein